MGNGKKKSECGVLIQFFLNMETWTGIRCCCFIWEVESQCRMKERTSERGKLREQYKVLNYHGNDCSVKSHRHTASIPAVICAQQWGRPQSGCMTKLWHRGIHWKKGGERMYVPLSPLLPVSHWIKLTAWKVNSPIFPGYSLRPLQQPPKKLYPTPYSVAFQVNTEVSGEARDSWHLAGWSWGSLGLSLQPKR